MMKTWAALIRGIGPTTHGRMSMVDLRTAAERAGLADVRTVLATGNLLFSAEGERDGVLRRVGTVIEGFGLTENPAILRDRAELLAMRDTCPFADAAEARPSKLLAVCLAGPAKGDAVEMLESHAGAERLALVGDTLWIDYVDGVGRSPLTPARIDRATGVAGTARNWNTLGRLIAAMS